jgi:hypothetical protein
MTAIHPARLLAVAEAPVGVLGALPPDLSGQPSGALHGP